MFRNRHWLLAWIIDLFAIFGFLMTLTLGGLFILISSHLAEERRIEREMERQVHELSRQPPPIFRDYVNVTIGCDEPCVITKNNGGNLLSFRKAADEVLSGRRTRIIITGLCASACAYFADLVREKTCITPSAVFGFHQAVNTGDPRVRTIPVHSPEIHAWVMDNGGFPPPSGMRFMPYAEARKFWKTCSD